MSLTYVLEVVSELLSGQSIDNGEPCPAFVRNLHLAVCLQPPTTFSRTTYLHTKDAKSAAAMLTSGFKYTPVSQLLLIWVVAASLVASFTDTKYYFYLQAVPHIWLWRQFWRLFTWQVCIPRAHRRLNLMHDTDQFPDMLHQLHRGPLRRSHNLQLAHY